MSRTRRRSRGNRRAPDAGQNRAQQDAGRRGKGKGGGGPAKPSTRGARKGGGAARGSAARGNGKQHGAAFWGDPDRLPEPREGLRINDQPDAVVRSLGTPPLRNHENIAVHYFAAVYDQAVRTAGALATAGGLIDVERLTAEMDDEPS